MFGAFPQPATRQRKRWGRLRFEALEGHSVPAGIGNGIGHELVNLHSGVANAQTLFGSEGAGLLANYDPSGLGPAVAIQSRGNASNLP